MRLFKKTSIKFIEKRKISLIVSLMLIGMSAFSLVSRGGPNFGIDFTGGALVQVKFSKDIQEKDLRDILVKNDIGNVSIQRFANTNTVIIRLKENVSETGRISKQLSGIFTEEIGKDGFIIERNEYVGPVIGEMLKKKAIYAFVFAFLGIIVYVAWRFQGGVWGAAGVIALIHDVLITFGILSLMGKEITLVIVAALLTLAGYSINDTIVVYDRIRDDMKLYFKRPLIEVFNLSINETLSRTIVTSITTMFVVLALFFKGGMVIHDFAITLIIGIIVGTYSSIFVASPIVYVQLSGKGKTKK